MTERQNSGGYASFEDWYQEVEGYALRAERLRSDPKELRAAFHAGRSEFAKPLPDVFLIMGCRCKRKFTRQSDGSFLLEAARPGEVFQFHDSISEETARDWFTKADSVWVPAKA